MAKVDGLPREDVMGLLQLFVIPLVLVLIGFAFSMQQDARQQEIENRRAESERLIEEQRAQDDALQAYLDQMGTLLTEERLRTAEEGSDVRALARARTLTVLTRLDPKRKMTILRFLHESKMIGKEQPIVDLNNADLSEIHIDYRDFISGDLILHDANLDGVNLTRSNLKDVEFDGADLRGANLQATQLQNAFLIDANLREAWLGSSEDVFTLSGTTTGSLEAADLSGADLSNADLFAAYLGGVDMSPMEYRLAYNDLREEQRTDLSGADLRNAILSNADLTGANLDGVDLTCANLTGTDFTNATGITKEQLENQAEYLHGATAPDGSTYQDPKSEERRWCPEPAAP